MSRYKIQAFLFVFVAFMLGCNEYMIVGVLPDISQEQWHISRPSRGIKVSSTTDFMVAQF